MTVQDFMIAAKIPKHLKGCEYLESAIQKRVDNPTMIGQDIYIEVGRMFNVSGYAVSKAIQRAIYESYDFMDDDMKKVLFPDRNTIPPSGMYIRNVAYSIRKGIL